MAKNREAREFDIVVLGAGGFTGRLVVEHLARLGETALTESGPLRWAVSGRDEKRTRAALAGIARSDLPFVAADLAHDDLSDLTRRADTVINVAGPFTPTAERVIAACVATATSYADLSGEIPLLESVIRRFDAPAKAAGVKIVQMAGWEALPADLVTLLASRRAIDAAGGTTGETHEGMGAAEPIVEVVVRARYTRKPTGKVPMAGAVSAGTLASIVEMLESDRARLVGRTAALLPDEARGQTAPKPLRLRPFTFEGRLLAPFAPVSFLNAPIVHRTAALRAAEIGVPYRPARYLEGVDVGPGGGAKGRIGYGRTLLQTATQRALIGIAHAPAPIRKTIAAALRRALPEQGSGPEERFLRDWVWSIEAVARHSDGATGLARLDGRGHPGYTATAAMLAELGLRMALGRAPDRSGCLTPALAMGTLDLDPWFVDQLSLG